MLELIQISNKLQTQNDLCLFDVEVGQLVDVVIYLKEHHQFIFFVDYSIEKMNEKYLLKILIKSLEEQKSVIVQTSFDKRQMVPSLGSVWAATYSFEDYYADYFDLNISTTDFLKNPKFDYHKSELEFDFSNQFPSIRFKEKEEAVTSLVIERVKNKSLKDLKNFHDLKTLKTIEQFNPKDAINCEIAYCMAVEKALGITIPEKARAIRMIFSEFQRIILHLDYFVQTHIVLKEFKEINFLINLKRKIFDLYLFYSKTDYNPKFNTIGGCLYDLPPGWIPMTSETLIFIKLELEKLYSSKMKSSLWVDKFPKKSNLTSKVLNWSLSGPNLRASGINYDLRKSEPYYFYHELDFDVPVGINGTSYDRFIVRLEEVYQSVKIILQVLDNLPYGDLYAKENFLWGNLKNNLSDRDNQKKYAAIITDGHKLNAGMFVSMIETSRGINGFLIKNNEEENSLHYLGSQDSSLYSMEALLCGVSSSEFSHELQSYGLHPWESTQS